MGRKLRRFAIAPGLGENSDTHFIRDAYRGLYPDGRGNLVERISITMPLVWRNGSKPVGRVWIEKHPNGWSRPESLEAALRYLRTMEKSGE